MQPIVERAGYVPGGKDGNTLFPRGHCAWTTAGVSELAHPGLRAEINGVAIPR